LCFAENIPQGIAAIVKNATEARIESVTKEIQNAKEKAGLFTPNKRQYYFGF
jgi:hypothetical protein